MPKHLQILARRILLHLAAFVLGILGQCHLLALRFGRFKVVDAKGGAFSGRQSQLTLWNPCAQSGLARGSAKRSVLGR